MIRPPKIVARFTTAGLHAWPGAPDRRAYLRPLHRHLFHVTVEVEVRHAEREVEFHDLAEHTAGLFADLGKPYHPESTLVNFGHQSCEHLASRLAALLTSEGYGVVRVIVSEDGENDGVWEA